MIIWKIRIIIRNIIWLIIQFFDHICYNSKKKSIKNEQKCVH